VNADLCGLPTARQLHLLLRVSRREKHPCPSSALFGDMPPAGKLLKIVSDIDDTLMCSGGHWPAGCDRRYPRKCIYPGVLAFFKELDTRQALRVQVKFVS